MRKRTYESTMPPPRSTEQCEAKLAGKQCEQLSDHKLLGYLHHEFKGMRWLDRDGPLVKPKDSKGYLAFRE